MRSLTVSHLPRLPHLNPLRIFYSLMAVMLLSMVTLSLADGVTPDSGNDASISTHKPMVPAEQWKRFALVTMADNVLSGFKNVGINFHYTTVPVVRIDGAEIAQKLPPAIWVKLEQPGNAVLLLESDSGVFIKVLEEVSPGFVSRCRMDPYQFGTLDGKPAEVDVRSVQVKSLWILQDADVADRQAPGFLALMPPDEIPGELPPIALMP